MGSILPLSATIGSGDSNPSCSKPRIKGWWSSPPSVGQFSGSRSRYIRNLEKEKKPSTMASGFTSHRDLPETVSATPEMYAAISTSSSSPKSSILIPNSPSIFAWSERFVVRFVVLEPFQQTEGEIKDVDALFFFERPRIVPDVQETFLKSLRRQFRLQPPVRVARPGTRFVAVAYVELLGNRA